MRIFLSWSGSESQAVAVTLRKNLPLILQSLDVFMSKHDIESGMRWAHELADELDKSSFGILCLTSESLHSAWLLFEAGSLVKHADGRACGLLIGGVRPTEISWPLAQFQHRQFEKSEFLLLLKDINNKLERSLSSEEVSRMLDKFWPDIEEEYNIALTAQKSNATPQPRSERELLEEILLRVRDVEITLQDSDSSSQGETGDVLSRPVTVDSVAWYSLWKFPTKPLSDKIQALMLRDLNKTKYRTIGDIDVVVNRARKAVEAYAEQNPDFFKFGTDYITKSLGFVDAEFRSRHGFAAKTLKAFETYQEFVEAGK